MTEIIRTHKEYLKFRRQNTDATHDEIRARVLDSLNYNPNLLVQVNDFPSVLKEEERIKYAKKIIATNQNWVREVQKLQDIMSNDELRILVLTQYFKSPWAIQIHKNQLLLLFSNDFFKNYFSHKESIDKELIKIIDEKEENFFKFFLLFNAHHSSSAFGKEIESIIKEKIKNAPQINAYLYGEREPGFACGGMEKNYADSSFNNGVGVCLVNDTLLAKYYHRKGEAKKVSYLPLQTYITPNDYIVWENYFYAPSEGQHNKVIEAIENGEKTLQIPDIKIKSVRPANNLHPQTIPNFLKIFEK